MFTPLLLAVLQNLITNSILVCESINGSLRGQFILINGKKVIEKDEEH